MRRKLMLLLTCLLIGIGLVNAQTSKVTGVVTSEEDGLPVVGASIMVKGTTIGTVTDLDGKFTLPNVPSSAETLLISFIIYRICIQHRQQETGTSTDHKRVQRT